MQSNKLSKKHSIRYARPERGSKYIAQGKFQGNVALGGSGVVGTPCKGKSKIRIYIALIIGLLPLQGALYACTFPQGAPHFVRLALGYALTGLSARSASFERFPIILS